MCDDEFRRFLEFGRQKYIFDELSDEWKVWAKELIESAQDVRVWNMRNQQTQLYLCRLMWVFEVLVDGGMLDGELLPKFVSGAVICGVHPGYDLSTVFAGALRECTNRGLVCYEEADWWEPGMKPGSGRVRLYKLTSAGRRFAEVGLDVNSSHASSGRAVEATETSVRSQGSSSLEKERDLPTPPYPYPQEYERDKWLYENISSYTLSDLSHKLKTTAQKNRWFNISSRNGIKKAADRYAEFHSLEQRRFAK